MSKIKFLFLAYFIGFLACSCSDKVAGTTEDENTLAQYSSSSSFDEISSSVAEVSSSSFGHIERSFNADSLIFDRGGWGAVITCPDSTEASEALEKSITLGKFISRRIEKLMTTGLSQEQADSTAQAELFAALGIDAFLREKPSQLMNVSNLINYIFGGTVEYEFYEGVEKTFTETGSLSKEHYCNYDFYPYYIDPDDDIEEVFPAHFLYESSLYIISGYENCRRTLFIPTKMVEIVDAKCYDLPQCDSTNIGKTVKAKYESEYDLDERILTCREKGWKRANALDSVTYDVPCDKEGKYIFYGGLPFSKSFVCSLDSGWYVAETIDAETFDVPCDKHGKLYMSPSDSTKTYVCRKEYFCREEYDYYKYDSLCMDEGWDFANKNDIEMSKAECDSEGKIFQSPSDSNLYYVCHDEKWKEFYNLPCDTDNKRVIIKNEKVWTGFTEYICYDKTWRPTYEWHTDYPADYYFNPEIDYGSFTDPRDNYVYHTVEFKGRTWIAENMKYAGFPDSVLAKETRCLEDSCKNVGRYYSINVAGEVCPEGWNLPDSSDILTLGTKQPETQDNISQLGGTGSAYSAPDTYGLSFILSGRIMDRSGYSPWQRYTALLWMNESNDMMERLVADIGYYTVEIWDVSHPEWNPSPDEDAATFVNQTFLPVRCVKK